VSSFAKLLRVWQIKNVVTVSVLAGKPSLVELSQLFPLATGAPAARLADTAQGFVL